MSKGILYTASGIQFVDEAAVSAARVSEIIPDVPIALITDVEEAERAAINTDVFDTIQHIESTSGGFSDQITSLSHTPFDRTLCLDTDIYMDAPVDDVFDLLDEFDIAAAHNHDGSAYDVAGVPDAFPEYNTGVVAYRQSDRFDRFLDSWGQWYDELSSPENTQNQPAFRKALYTSDLRVATLPSEYNTMLRYPGHAQGPVKLFHGRLLDIDTPGAGKYLDVPEASRTINATEQHRTWTLLGGLTLHTDKQDSQVNRFRLIAEKEGVSEAIRRTVRKLLSGRGGIRHRVRSR